MRNFFAVIGLFTGVYQTEAAVIYTSFGNGADTFVQATDTVSPLETNFGAGTTINVKNPSTPNRFTRKSYLRFDLSALSLSSITEATLSLTVQQNNSGGTNVDPAAFTVNVYGLNDGVGEDWIEGNNGTDNTPTGEIVWSNAPANDVLSGTGFTTAAAFLGTLSVTTADIAGTTVTFASNPALINFLSADTDDQVTFMLARTEGDAKNLTFYTKEFSVGNTSDEPTLTIIPEPAQATLLGLGCLVVLLRRRK